MTGESGSVYVLRPLELLGVLREHEVDFVVIGAFSLSAHGFVRGTKDVDIVPAPDPANLERLLGALDHLEAEPLEVEDFRPEELPLDLDLEGLLQGGNWALRTRLGRLDVMQYVIGIEGYAPLRERSVAETIPEVGGLVRFAGLEDLIAMKRAAGRPQDLVDIAALERISGADA